MAILSTIKKIRPYIKTATGYIKLKLFADDVVTNDGKTVQDEIDTINTNLTDNSIIEQGSGGDSYTSYSYVKYGNGLLEVFGSSFFNGSSNTSEIRTVNFPKAVFKDIRTMNVFLTPQRNSNLLSKLMQCDASGNVAKTQTSFVASCNKVSSKYAISFDFYVRGFWK